MRTVVEHRREPVVRWKAAWSDPWTDIPRGAYEVGEVVEGVSNGAGRSSLTVYVTTFSREEGAPTPPTIPRDAFVQIGAEDVRLPTSDPDRIRWLWIGYVSESAWDHLGTETSDSGRDPFIVKWTHSLEGLGGLFARVTLQRAAMRANGTLVECPFLPTFNGGTDGALRGNRSTTANGDGTFPFDLTRGATSGLGLWTARQAAERLLADHLPIRFPTWPTFAIGGQVDALGYADVWSFEGIALGEALTELAGIGRGCSWTIEPAASGSGPVTIRITSALAAPVSTSAITLPASDRQVAAIETGLPHFRLSSSLVDRGRKWTVQGVCKTTLTLAYIPGGGSASALVRGWDPALVGSWDPNDPRFALFWRFYRLNPGWDGRGWNSVSSIAQSLRETAGAFDGVRLITGGPAPNESAAIEPEMVIPGLASTTGQASAPVSLATWAASPGTALAGDAPLERLRAWIVTGGDLANAREITDLVEIAAVSDPAPGIILGRSPAQAREVRDLIGSSTLLVTTTILEPLPMMVGRAPATGAAIDQMIVAKTAALHQVLGGTYLGNAGTTPIVVSGDRAVRDDRPRIQALLAGLGPYLDRAGAASISDGADLHAATDPRRPGAYVATIEDGRGPSYATAIRAIITGRTWNFAREAYGTRLSLEPLNLDLRSYL